LALDPSGYPDTLDPARRRLLGSYYTPGPLIAHLVEAALDPLLPWPGSRSAAARDALESALSLRVLDPAVGDGSFLVEVARCMARRLAASCGLPEAPLRAEVARRCLRGVDVDPVAARLARRRVRQATGAAPVIFTADALADPAATEPGALAEESFDVVVGNPPWGGWNRGLDRETKRSYRARFSLARGMLDPAMLFLERCIAWLRPGGRLALVLPEYFLIKNYPAARAHVLAHLRLEELARWGMAFPGVNVGACSLVASRRGGTAAMPAREASRLAPPGGGRVRCLPQGPGGPVLLTRAAAFAREPGHVFNLELDEAGRRLLARLLREGTPLARLVEAHEGIHSGNARSRLFVPPGARDPAAAAAATLRPLVMGSAELRPFVLRPAGWRVVYDRAVLRRSRGEYANLGQAAWYRPPKLLVRRTGDRVVAAVDRSGVMASNNLFVARVRPRAGAAPEFLAACLNAPLATWCFRAMVPRAGAAFAELKLAHLGRLPIPRPPADRPGQQAISRLRALARRLEDPALPDGAAERADALSEIDRIVCDLAGLSASDRTRIHQPAPTSPRRP
jgi:SAM-dependent methyltransferase